MILPVIWWSFTHIQDLVNPLANLIRKRRVDRERKSIICPGEHQNTSHWKYSLPPPSLRKRAHVERRGIPGVCDPLPSLRRLSPKPWRPGKSRDGWRPQNSPPTWGTLALQISAMMWQMCWRTNSPASSAGGRTHPRCHCRWSPPPRTISWKERTVGRLKSDGE